MFMFAMVGQSPSSIFPVGVVAHRLPPFTAPPSRLHSCKFDLFSFVAKLYHKMIWEAAKNSTIVFQS